MALGLGLVPFRSNASRSHDRLLAELEEDEAEIVRDGEERRGDLVEHRLAVPVRRVLEERREQLVLLPGAQTGSDHATTNRPDVR